MIATFRRLAMVCCMAGLSVTATARADGEGGDHPQRATGKIVALTPTRITIQQKGDERMLELTLDDKTRVVTCTDDVVRVVTGRGDVQELRKAVDAKVADLRVDHWVNVLYADGTAVQVFSSMIGRDQIGDGGGARQGIRDGDKPRAGGEGDRVGGERDRVREAADRPREGGDKPREGGERNRLRDGDGRRAGDGDQAGERAGERAREKVGDNAVRRDGDGVRREGDGVKRDGDGIKRDGDGVRRDGDGGSAMAASLLVGDIGGVDAGKLTVNLTRRNRQTGASTAVTIEPTTTIQIEGKPGKPEDLRPGMPVSVTVEKGVAVRIEVPIDLSKPRGEE